MTSSEATVRSPPMSSDACPLPQYSPTASSPAPLGDRDLAARPTAAAPSARPTSTLDVAGQVGASASRGCCRGRRPYWRSRAACGGHVDQPPLWMMASSFHCWRRGPGGGSKLSWHSSRYRRGRQFQARQLCTLAPRSRLRVSLQRPGRGGVGPSSSGDRSPRFASGGFSVRAVFISLARGPLPAAGGRPNASSS